MSELDDYFTTVSPDEILIRGTRIGIEAVLSEYREGSLPEQIVLDYPPLTLEQVHATITYYLRNRQQLDSYLSRWCERGETARQRQASTPLVERLAQHRKALANP
jgi:uncharacterized protein (DUF433 family)